MPFGFLSELKDCLLTGRMQNVKIAAESDRISPELLFGGFMMTVSLPPAVRKPQ